MGPSRGAIRDGLHGHGHVVIGCRRERKGPQPQDRAITHEAVAWQHTHPSSQHLADSLESHGGVRVQRAGARGIPPEVGEGLLVDEHEAVGGHRPTHLKASGSPWRERSSALASSPRRRGRSAARSKAASPVRAAAYVVLPTESGSMMR